jgi:Mor family transcriptional regulator
MKAICNIKGFEKYTDYFVDEKGNIYSTKLNNLNKLIPSPRKGRGPTYLRIALVRNDGTGKKTFSVHQLVALAYLYRSNWKELQVDHKDRNSLNNDLNNLHWVTASENKFNSDTRKRFKSDPERLEIALDYKNSGAKLSELAIKYKCSIETIWNIVHNSGIDNSKKKRYLLSKETKDAIRTNRISGCKLKDLSIKYNTTLSNISFICKGITQKKD